MSTSEHYKIRKTMNCEHLNKVGSGFMVQGFMGTIELYKIRKTMNCEHLNKIGSGFQVQSSGFRVQGSGFRVQGSMFRVREFMGTSELYKIRKTMNCEHLNEVGSGFEVQKFKVQKFRVQKFRSSWVQVNFTRFVKL